MGYKPVQEARPNTTHYAIAALQYTNIIPKLITQNVDGLHHKSLAHVWDVKRMKERILELHGSLHVRICQLRSSSCSLLIYTRQKVHCSNGHVVDRQIFQERLSAANPQWKAYMDELEATGQRPRTNPDGDVSPRLPFFHAYMH